MNSLAYRAYMIPLFSMVVNQCLLDCFCHGHLSLCSNSRHGLYSFIREPKAFSCLDFFHLHLLMVDLQDNAPHLREAIGRRRRNAEARTNRTRRAATCCTTRPQRPSGPAERGRTGPKPRPASRATANTKGGPGAAMPREAPAKPEAPQDNTDKRAGAGGHN